MTNHSYFNLNGDPSKEGFDQIMYVNAESSLLQTNSIFLQEKSRM